MNEIRLNTRIATIDIDGETKIVFPDKYNSIIVRTDSEIGISPLPNKNIGDENVLRCKANESTVYAGVYNTYIYLIGSGKIEIILGNNFNLNPFKVVGGSGGGGSTPILINKTIVENGIYNANEDNADGYNKVTVDVSASPDVGEKNITANGTYTAADDSLDGYDVVNVNVPVGLTFDYVDGNIGYISMNKFTNRNIGIHIPEFPYNIPNGSDVTFEYCLCFDSGRTHPGRYHQNSADFLLSDDVIDNKYYLDLSFDSGVTWAIDSAYELIEIPQDRDMTLTLRIDSAKTDIFIDGEFYVQTTSANSMMLPHLTVNETRFMYGTTSNRVANGKFYAARFYSRALTDAEIMHNHEQDVKLIEFINN